MTGKISKIVKVQFWVLLGGTLFAWGNFAVELFSWIDNTNCPTGCLEISPNPFLSPCFGGAVFFTLAFILNLLIKKNEK